MKKYLYLIISCLFVVNGLFAQTQEKLLYSTDFQEWNAIVSNATSPGTVVPKTTSFTQETLNFTFFKTLVAPTGRANDRFAYADETPPDNIPATGASLVTPGWAIADKAADAYIQLSSLASVTKVIFTHGATGSSRGFRVWKKNATDADWVSLTSATSYANPSSGQTVTVDVNDENVALKFTNLNGSQNAYMFDLKIYGNYTPVGVQRTLTTAVNITNAGSIVQTPNSSEYSDGTSVTLNATANFGYKFLKWVDVNNGDAELSTANPYQMTMNDNKSIKAIFQSLNTYNFNVNILGSNWGEVRLSPLPTAGKYVEGTEVTMTIIPNSVTSFSYWDDNSTIFTRTVTVNADVNYSATFDEIPFIVGWDFRVSNPTSNRESDYYSVSDKRGMISVYSGVSNTAVGWLSNAGISTPSYPNLRLWTPAAEFNANTPRYLQAQFSTLGYKNIVVKSMLSGSNQGYALYKLQYSLDGNVFTDIPNANVSIKSVDYPTSVYKNTWSNLNVTLPVQAEGQAIVYLRWVGDATGGKLDTNTGNPGTDVEGTAFTNIFMYGDKEIVNDTDAPLLISAIPAQNSTTATINGSIVLTFNERVKKGSGDITLNGKILTGVFGAKTATFAYEKLAYNTSYTLQVPAGALTDQSNNPFASYTLTFTTNTRLEPVKKAFDAIVAKDGSGDYLTIKDAISAAPINRSIPWVIYIKNGIYSGHHEIPVNKPFIHLIGQSRDGVVVTDNVATDTNPNWETGSTIYVAGANCYFENIIFQNEFGYIGKVGPPALAFYTKGDHFSMKNCYLRSFQDTYYTGNISTNRYYIVNSRIEGAVDYIYGDGNIFFDKDTLTNVRTGSVIVAPDHSSATLYGYVFRDCIINEDASSAGNHKFGRPWKGTPKAVFINTKAIAGINPEGWADMGVVPEVFADYGTFDKNGNLLDRSQRKSSYYTGGVFIGIGKNTITDQEAASYTYENVVLRSGDTWDPRIISEAPEQPSNLHLQNNVLTWDATLYTRLYIVLRNNIAIGFPITNQYTDNTALPGVNYAYKVQAVSEFGALSTASVVVQTLPITGLEIKATKINQKAQIQWSTLAEIGTSYFAIERYNAENVFEEIGRKLAIGNSNVKQTYYFTDDKPLGGVNFYRIKAVDFNGHFENSQPVVVEFANQELKVYPNPSSDFIQVSTTEKELSITIFNMDGKKVVENMRVENAQPISVSFLNPGIYMVEIRGAKTKQVVKFIKI